MPAPAQPYGRRALNRIIADALNDLGLSAFEDDGANGFLDRVAVRDGRLHFAPDAPPSNLLHEAGHLACIPSRFRHLADGDLEHVFDTMGKALENRYSETGNADDPLIKAIMQCSDPEATAWAWAFGTRLGIPAESIIHDDEYDGAGAMVRLQVSTGNHCGIHGLRAAGMIATVRDYPRLEKWVQDAD